MYQIMTHLKGENMGYGVLSVKDRTQWKTKRIAEKHARDFKAKFLRDSWVEEV